MTLPIIDIFSKKYDLLYKPFQNIYIDQILKTLLPKLSQESQMLESLDQLIDLILESNIHNSKFVHFVDSMVLKETLPIWLKAMPEKKIKIFEDYQNSTANIDYIELEKTIKNIGVKLPLHQNLFHFSFINYFSNGDLYTSNKPISTSLNPAVCMNIARHQIHTKGLNIENIYLYNIKIVDPEIFMFAYDKKKYTLEDEDEVLIQNVEIRKKYEEQKALKYEINGKFFRTYLVNVEIKAA